MANTEGQNTVKIHVVYTECVYRIEAVLSTKGSHNFSSIVVVWTVFVVVMLESSICSSGSY